MLVVLRTSVELVCNFVDSDMYLTVVAVRYNFVDKLETYFLKGFDRISCKMLNHLEFGYHIFYNTFFTLLFPPYEGGFLFFERLSFK